MMHFLTKILGLAPEAPKTGAREAGLFIFLCILFLTTFAALSGPELFSAMSGLLIVMWPTALAFMGYAFKLKSNRNHASVAVDTEASE